jgi:hypothetical protein
MSQLPIRQLRLRPFSNTDLQIITGTRGEIYFDTTTGTLRIYNGIAGGEGLLKDDLSNIKAVLNKSVNFGTGAVTAAQFIGTINGNTVGTHTGAVVGNVTGNTTGTHTGAVVGNVTGNTTGTHTGAVVGNASTATTLQTTRSINGVSFDGSTNITVTAAAGTLTGAAINASVTASSLTSVGTLTSLAVTNDITANANVVINQTPQLPTHATNKRYTDSRAIAFSVALS